MNELTKNDLRYIVTQLPRDIRDLLTENAGKLFVGGGFIRATIAGEEPSDIDLFGIDKDFLATLAKLLSSRRDGSRLHTTENAITLLTPNKLPIQFITRWTFQDVNALVKSFDFTVCQAAIWRYGKLSNSEWLSEIGENFYIDLAGKRLVYTKPVRDEEPGGSMMRVLKYLKRGYSIQVDSLGHVIARMVDKIQDRGSGVPTGQIIAGMLREVDPLLIVDGMEMPNDHETEENGPT